MIDLSTIDYFEQFKKSLTFPKGDFEEYDDWNKLIENENQFGRVYKLVRTNIPHLDTRKILSGDIKRVNFEPTYLADFRDYYRISIKIIQYKEVEPHIIRVKICYRSIKDSPYHYNKNDSLVFTKKYSLYIKFDTISKKFLFVVKYPKMKPRITYLSFNTAKYLREFIDMEKIKEFTIFFLKSSSNEFLLNSNNIDFIESLFNNFGKNYVFFNLQNKKLPEITNPTALYRILTGYKTVNKNLLKLSIRNAIMLSKLLNEKDQQKFFDLIFNETIVIKTEARHIKSSNVVIELICIYYVKKLSFFESPNNFYLIRDYINLTQELNEKINVDINSFRRLKEEHDELTKKQRRLEIPEITAWDMYLNVLKSSDTLDIELINDRNKLGDEADAMNHCVYSYYNEINSGKCAIFSIKNKAKPKERWTLDLRCTKMVKINNDTLKEEISIVHNEDLQRFEEVVRYQYHIGQLRGYNNDDPPDWVYDELKAQLTIITDNHIKEGYEPNSLERLFQ